MSGTTRVAIVTTHPIQYQVPWFQDLANRTDLDLTVMFCMIPDARQQGDGFSVEFQWDLPLLDGYRYEVLANVAREPSLTTFRGCDAPMVEDKLREGRFDAVIVNGWVAKVCLQALQACRRAGIPCVVRGESNALRRRPLWKRLAHRLLLRQYAAFLAIGKLNRDFYIASGVPPERVFDGHYCVDNRRFGTAADALARVREELRAQWRIPRGVATFLFCGKLAEKKRPFDLLRAVEGLVSGGAGPLHVVFAGDGPLRESCERFAAERGLPVTFTGFLNQSRVVEAYVAADCLVLPSDEGETWGLVVNEAMACGRPAIVSDLVGCHPDLIRPGLTGDVFKCGDVSSLRATIGRWMETDTLAGAGAHARRHVSSYSIERLVTGTLEAVHHVSAHRRAA